jgi:hypothetical protein
MTATIHVLAPESPPPPPLLPEEIHYDRFVPDEIQEALLDAFASPDLTREQRAEFWETALHWVRLREYATDRTGHPEDVLMRPGTADEAEEAAREIAQGEIALVVNGTRPARGSRTIPTGDWPA